MNINIEIIIINVLVHEILSWGLVPIQSSLPACLVKLAWSSLPTLFLKLLALHHLVESDFFGWFPLLLI